MTIRSMPGNRQAILLSSAALSLLALAGCIESPPPDEGVPMNPEPLPEDPGPGQLVPATNDTVGLELEGSACERYMTFGLTDPDHVSNRLPSQYAPGEAGPLVALSVDILACDAIRLNNGTTILDATWAFVWAEVAPADPHVTPGYDWVPSYVFRAWSDEPVLVQALQDVGFNATRVEKITQAPGSLEPNWNFQLDGDIVFEYTPIIDQAPADNAAPNPWKNRFFFGENGYHWLDMKGESMGQLPAFYEAGTMAYTGDILGDIWNSPEGQRDWQANQWTFRFTAATNETDA